MPKLPANELSRDSQLLEKSGWDRGAVGQKKVWVPKFKPPSKSHLKLLFGILIIVFVLVGVYVGAVKFFPGLLNDKKTDDQVQNAEIPVDITKISFPSEQNKQRLIEELRLAKDELNLDKRYEHVERSFIIIYNSYLLNHSPDTRAELEKFRDYVKTKFGAQYEKNIVLYEFQCLDSMCLQKEYPQEILDIKQRLSEIGSIDPLVLDSIYLNFEAAISHEDKVKQSANYINALAALKGEFERTQDEALRAIHDSLLAYVKASYPDARIPDLALL